MNRNHRQIIAEVWERPKLLIPHSKPLSRHYIIEGAIGKVKQLRSQWPNTEPGYFVVLVLKNGEFAPLKPSTSG